MFAIEGGYDSVLIRTGVEHSVGKRVSMTSWGLKSLYHLR